MVTKYLKTRIETLGEANQSFAGELPRQQETEIRSKPDKVHYICNGCGKEMASSTCSFCGPKAGSRICAEHAQAS